MAVVTKQIDGSVGKKVKDVMNDPTGNIGELKGILSQALSGLPFRVGIFIVLFHILYISYKHFWNKNRIIIIQDDCFCDQIVYHVITFTLMGTWTLFLPGYAVH